MDEPYFQSTKNNSLFPITDDDIYKEYKTQLSSFWVVEEVSLNNDYEDFCSLSNEEQYFIKMILSFFSGSDILVIENIGKRFLAEIKMPELLLAYGFQNMMEGIHSEMYALLIDTYIKDDTEKLRLFNSINNFPCIKKKADWAKRWTDDTNAIFSKRVLCFCLVEGIFFSSSFAAIFWLKKRGIMKGLTLSNEFISRDEGLHTQLAVVVYKKCKNRLPQSEVFEIVKEAVDIEIEFITQSLPCRLIGMNQRLMEQHIKFVADRLLVQLGYKKLYNTTKTPFDFMELISLQSKGNFFETNISAYSLDTNNKEESNFNFDADF